MELNWHAARLVWDVFVTLWVASIALYCWYSTRNQATSTAIREVEDLVAVERRRVDELYHQVDRLPGWDERSKIEDRLDQISHTLASMGGELRATNRLLNVLHNDRLAGDRG